MRVATVAVWTLAALAVNELPQTAIAAPELPVPENVPTLDDSIDAAVVLEPIEAIAPPEQWSGVPRFHRPASHRAIASPPPNSPSAELPQGTAQVESLTLPNITTGAIAPPEQIVSRPLVIQPLVSQSLASATAPTTPTTLNTPNTPTTLNTPNTPNTPNTRSTPLTPPTLQIETETELLAQGQAIAVPAANPASTIPAAEEVETLRQQLQNLQPPESETEYEGAPALTLSNPSGYGADQLRGFVSGSFQERTRYSDTSDGTLGIGIGLGNAQESVGVQLSYTIASFGSNRDFGTGGFNVKLHHQFADGWSAAAGWEGFATIGDEVDFEDSIYGSVTHIIRTNPDLDTPFSRVALTAGVGNGRFRSEDDFNDDDDAIGGFGSIALRVARPVSAIVEWTGQDLAAGLSIAPIRDFPLVITPALRDITGAGDGARFVLGVGLSFQL